MNTLTILFDKFITFLKAINVNAFWAIYYFFANNIFAIIGIALFVFVIYHEIQVHKDMFLDDGRSIF